MENLPSSNSENRENDELNDPTWDLLKEARPVEPGAFFSRTVVREVRHLADKEAASGGFFAWLRQPVVALAGAAAAIAIVAVSLNNEPSEQGLVNSGTIGENAPDTGIVSPSTEFADVNYLGDLMAVSDPSTLTDRAFADLF